MVSMSLERVLSLVGDFFEIYVCFNIGLVSLECKVSGRFKDQRAIVVEDVCNGRGCETFSGHWTVFRWLKRGLKNCFAVHF
jgi:hypothetical protein